EQALHLGVGQIVRHHPLRPGRRYDADGVFTSPRQSMAAAPKSSRALYSMPSMSHDTCESSVGPPSGAPSRVAVSIVSIWLGDAAKYHEESAIRGSTTTFSVLKYCGITPAGAVGT